MAKLPALVSAVAAVDGRDRRTIDNFARVVREAGYMPTGKRGSGAAEMTTKAAANLLIALNSAEMAKDAPMAIDRVRSFSLWDGMGVPYDDCPDALKEIENNQNFGLALEALIDAMPALIAHYAVPLMGAQKGGLVIKSALKGHGPFNVKVEVRRTGAEISLWFSNNGTQKKWAMYFGLDTDRHEAGFYGYDSPDREVTVSFSLPTLFAVWRCLAGEDATEPGDLIVTKDSTA